MVEVFDFEYIPYTPEEKVIDGVLCVKYNKSDDFTPLSAEDLTELYLYARENLEQTNRRLDMSQTCVACEGIKIW